MEAEIAAIRKALKRIDHSDTTERKIGLDAEAALDRIEKRLKALTEKKKKS